MFARFSKHNKESLILQKTFRQSLLVCSGSNKFRDLMAERLQPSEIMIGMTVLPLIAMLCLNFQGYQPHGPKIRFEMESGKSFVVTTDPAASPKTVAHILKLVRARFYDRQRIHRVESWVTQWGAPASRNEPLTMGGKDPKKNLNPRVGDGSSGQSVPFEGSRSIDFVRGVVGIASEGLQLGGDSQIFVLKSDRTYLMDSYAVLGKVTEGMSTVDSIKFGDRIAKAIVVSSR